MKILVTTVPTVGASCLLLLLSTTSFACGHHKRLHNQQATTASVHVATPTGRR